MTLPVSIGTPASSTNHAPVQVPVVLPQLPRGRRKEDHVESPAEARRGRCKIWGVPFDAVTMTQSIDRIEEMVRTRVPSFVITANLNFAMLCQERPELGPVIRDADLIVADGQPIVWRSQLGGRPLPERVAGSEMIYKIAERATQRGWKIYFLGGEPDVAQKCADVLGQHYPGLQIVGVESPPFRELTPEETAEQRQRIQSSDADILLVAFGQPKGELWIHQHYQLLAVPVSIQLGASFDFVAGTANRAPKAWQRFGLEWVHRMASDPKRLVPRYAGNAWFLVRSLVRDWRFQVSQWGMWDSRNKSGR